MNDIVSAFAEAFRLIITFDSDLAEIIWLSAKVSAGAVVIAALIGCSVRG